MVLAKRRFVKREDGAEKGKVFFMKLEEKKKAARQRRLEAEKTAKAEAVTLLKTYKVGPVPDIQIPHKDFVAPLQALAQVKQLVQK